MKLACVIAVKMEQLEYLKFVFIYSPSDIEIKLKKTKIDLTQMGPDRSVPWRVSNKSWSFQGGAKKKGEKIEMERLLYSLAIFTGKKNSHSWLCTSYRDVFCWMFCHLKKLHFWCEKRGALLADVPRLENYWKCQKYISPYKCPPFFARIFLGKKYLLQK